jgi:hypothetical protein
MHSSGRDGHPEGINIIEAHVLDTLVLCVPVKVPLTILECALPRYLKNCVHRGWEPLLRGTKVYPRRISYQNITLVLCLESSCNSFSCFGIRNTTHSLDLVQGRGGIDTVRVRLQVASPILVDEVGANRVC